MPPAARITDMHTCPKVEPGPVPHVGGPIAAGDPSVLIGFVAAARVGDPATCVGPTDTIAAGEPSVKIGFMDAARLGDPTNHGGVIVAGCPTVLIGVPAQAQALVAAAETGAPFCEECARAGGGSL
jgi:uncharacterized Zn-binding protein involved in type VI secretion